MKLPEELMGKKNFFCLLEPANVISILISSEFLKMDSLVSIKKGFCAIRVRLVSVSNNLFVVLLLLWKQTMRDAMRAF